MRKISIITLMMLSLLLLPTVITSITAQAKPTVSIYLLTDKAHYKYGQSGKLYITVRNEGPGPIAIRTISVTFPWFGWYHGGWTGNETLTDLEDSLVDENDTSIEFEVEFTVPAEGRAAISSVATVTVEYEWSDESDSETEYIPIEVEIPVTQSEVLPLILSLTAFITVLFIIVLIALFFVWLSFRKLTLAPAASASQ